MVVDCMGCFLSRKRRRTLRSALSVELVFLFGRDAERDASVERHGLDLDVEALAVGVLPCGPDAGPEALLAFAVTHLVGDVAGSLGSGVVRVGHGEVSLSCFRPRPSRPDGTRKEPPQPGRAKASAPVTAENGGSL